MQFYRPQKWFENTFWRPEGGRSAKYKFVSANGTELVARHNFYDMRSMSPNVIYLVYITT